MIPSVYCLLSLFNSIYDPFLFTNNQDNTSAPLTTTGFTGHNIHLVNLHYLDSVYGFRIEFFPFFNKISVDTMSKLEFLFTIYVHDGKNAKNSE